MAIKFTNNASATLASGINSSVTTISLTVGQGALFPTLSAGDYFYATLIDSSNNLEIVKVTSRATDTLTVLRGQDGTTARSYNAGDRFELRLTAAAMNDIGDGANLSSAEVIAALGYTPVDKAGDTISGNLTVSGNISTTGNQGVGVYLQATGSGAARLPVGTTAQRPASPAAGDSRLNSTTGKFEGYNGTAWGALGAGAAGGGTDGVFFENDITVTTDYTITTNKNAMSAGPITINAGITVTVPNGSVWTIV